MQFETCLYFDGGCDEAAESCRRALAPAPFAPRFGMVADRFAVSCDVGSRECNT